FISSGWAIVEPPSTRGSPPRGCTRRRRRWTSTPASSTSASSRRRPTIVKRLGIERDATRAGAGDEYVSMVDETIPRLGTRARESHYRLLQAKARILSGDPARFS